MRSDKVLDAHGSNVLGTQAPTCCAVTASKVLDEHSLQRAQCDHTRCSTPTAPTCWAPTLQHAARSRLLKCWMNTVSNVLNAIRQGARRPWLQRAWRSRLLKCL